MASLSRRLRINYSVVLVVDDVPSVSEVLALMLDDFGCDVLTASSGKAALSMLAQQHVDVLIADIDMPGMKGTDLAQRATERWPNLRVLWVHRIAKAVRSGKAKTRNGGDDRPVLKGQISLFVRDA